MATGPSLNKNIEVLKKCMDRAVVIAAGSAMGVLYAQGITPSFLAVSEARAVYDDDLVGVLDPRTILLSLYDIHHKVVSEYPGKRLFAIDQTTMSLDSVKHLLPNTDILCTHHHKCGYEAFNFAHIAALARLFLSDKICHFQSIKALRNMR